MRNSYRRRGHGYSAYSRPKQNKKVDTTISESDLIRTIEYSRQKPEHLKVAQAEEQEVLSKYTDLQIDSRLKNNIARKGYVTMTPIQDQAIPYILDGSDLIGIANTGTGKTAAFLIPLIEKVLKDSRQRVLIIAPTRELAEQINNEFKALVQGMDIFSSLLIGGMNYRFQIRDLKRQPNFIIGTPGRIKDLLEKRAFTLTSFNNVVLDETDRMVDIGFIREIKHFISLLPKQRQSLFFSATVPKKVEEILQAFVQDAVTVSVKKQDTGVNIHQDYIRVSRNEVKVDRLHALLKSEEFSKVIVFGNTKWGVQKLANELFRRGVKAEAIHGNKRQSQRRTILEKFKRDQVTVLLATDVAARGLDISDVSHVINYDLPKTYDEYIHRIGRTGRADKRGVALTFVSAE